MKYGVNTHMPHTHTHTQRDFFVTLAFGLKRHQDILEGEEKQESKSARDDSRGRRKPLSLSINPPASSAPTWAG